MPSFNQAISYSAIQEIAQSKEPPLWIKSCEKKNLVQVVIKGDKEARLVIKHLSEMFDQVVRSELNTKQLDKIIRERSLVLTNYEKQKSLLITATNNHEAFNEVSFYPVDEFFIRSE